MSSKARKLDASRVINAPARKIFAFLARPDNHVLPGTSGMIRGPAGHATMTEMGAVFAMNMHNEMKGDHQAENHVAVYEPDRAIGRAPAEPGHQPAGHTWVWRLAPIADNRTLVTQTYDWPAFSHAEMLDHLPVINHDQLQASLDRLAEAVDDQAGAP